MNEPDEIVDRQQAEIRQAVADLDTEMKTASGNLEDARIAFERFQSTYPKRLLEIRGKCKHIHVTRTAITKTCNDCGAFGVTGV